jgi:hypothetical protein
MNSPQRQNRLLENSILPVQGLKPLQKKLTSSQRWMHGATQKRVLILSSLAARLKAVPFHSTNFL